MQVTLIHNPGAGAGADGVAPDALARMMRAQGHEVRAVGCDDPAWTAIVEEPADLVAVLGGDGTIGRVARRLVGRGVPIAALAAGTANNIAMTLGTESVPPEEQVRAWADGRRLAFDVCVATGPFGTEHLLEGLGVGLFAWGMRTADRSGAPAPRTPGERIARVLAMLNERVGGHPTTRIEATLDGKDLSGDYVMLEAMNTQFVGPNLFLAPGAHPGDGMIDVVTVDHDARESFREQLASWRRGALRPADWPARRGRHLTLRWTGFPLHLDDRLWPDAGTPEPDEPAPIDVRVRQAALEFLVPARTDHPPVP